VGYTGGHLLTTQRSRYPALAVVMGTLIASLLSVSAASASDVTVSNCAKLQPILNAAEAGEVITLAALCTASNSGASKGSFRLPSNVADLTIEGQSGMTAGFEGAGVAKPALEGRGNGLALRNLVVENYSLDEKSAVTLDPSEGALPQIESDRFIDDVQTNTSGNPRGGALYLSTSNSTCAYTTPLSITSSLFQGDQIIDTSTHTPSDHGGAVSAEIFCNSASAPVDFATLTADTFTDDSIDTATGREAFGGALYLANRSSAGVLVSATQSGNVFEADTIAATAPTELYGGGGEWVPSIVLTSSDDRFVKDALPAPQGSGASSEGSGLGVISATCAEAATASATLNNAIVAANTIGPASEGGQSAGAGIYIACEPTAPNGHFHLTLNDSTVAGNQAPEGIAGIDGEDTDELALSNSIVTGSPGQADIGGFRAVSDGSLTSLFSDACAPGTSTPLSGQGNICAEPLLADAETGDVQETVSSPTIDAGSNALVPEDLTMDAFGDPRIVAGRAGCSESFPAAVDMGADEYEPPLQLCPPPFHPPLTPPPLGLTEFVSLKESPTGAALTLSCSSSDGLGCSGTIFLTLDETLQGKKVIAVSASSRTEVPVRIGQASFALAAGSTSTFQIKLNSTGLTLLHRFHAISALVLANQAVANNGVHIFLLHTARFSEPKRKHKKHHKSKTH